MRGLNPCTFEKACHIKYLVYIGLTLTQAAIVVKVNVGSVCHVVHGRRFPAAFPIAPPGYGE